MPNSHKDHTKEELGEPKMSAAESASEKSSATEIRISVDDTPSDEPLLGSNEKDLTKSATPNASELPQGDVGVKTYEHYGVPDPAVFVDVLYARNPKNFASGYHVPEKIRSLDDYQAGYPRLAAAQNSDPNFSVYSKHGWLHNRLLLHTQAELHELEREIQRADKHQSEGHPASLCNYKYEAVYKKKLFADAKVKLEEYDNLLFGLRKKLAMKKPTREDQNSVMHFVYPSLILGHDTDWICRTDDLVVLADEAEQSWFFRKSMEWVTRCLPELCATLFRTRAQRIIAGKCPGLKLYSPARLETFARVLLTIFATALALAPLNAMHLLSRDQALTIYFSTLGFFAFCALCTKASRGQLFAATAGYLALQVLAMIFGSERKF